MDKVLYKGNEAVAEGAIAAGLKCYFGYPITPQNDIPERLSWALPAKGGAFIQAESELAAVNMLHGAAATGTRSMTSSSSPGLSLKQETISYMASAEIPGVIVNMMRGGPGLGDIGPAQGDYFQAVKGGGHGDYHLIVLAPSGCQEAYDMTIEAFDLAFAWRCPVMILGDAIISQMKEPVTPWQPEGLDPETEAANWRLDGAKGRERRVIRTLFLEEGELAGRNLMLQQKYKDMAPLARAEEFLTEDADLVVAAFGSMGRIAKSAIRRLRQAGHKVGLVRPQTLFPFPAGVFARLGAQGKRFLTIEHNFGQMVEDVRLSLAPHGTSAFHGFCPGTIPAPEDFEEAILACLKGA